jgi:hypothetical protein
MVHPPSGDPDGNPTSTSQNMMIFSPPSPPPVQEFRRITRSYKRPRNDSTARPANNKTPDIQFVGKEANSTKLDEVVKLIADLKKIIIEQNNIIGNLKTDLGQIKAEQDNLKNQNAELQEEIRFLRTQLNASSTSASSPRSWASVAASNGTTATAPSVPSLSKKDNANKEPNCIRISTQPRSAGSQDTETSFARYLPIESSNTYIRRALVSANSTKDVQVAGIGTTKTGYIIRFKDPQSAETARSNAEWLRTLGNGTKLVKPRFGVVVHRVPTTQFSLPDNSKEGIQKLMNDNDFLAKGFQIDEITWLKKQEKQLGAHASMGIWFTTAEAANWVINNGLLLGQQYIGSVVHYQIKQKRCYRCQRFGHLAFACKEQARCGHCAGEHERQNCAPGTRPRCLDCSGPHPTGDRNCHSQSSPSTSQ